MDKIAESWHRYGRELELVESSKFIRTKTVERFEEASSIVRIKIWKSIRPGKQYPGWKETPIWRETSKLVHVCARCYVAASNRREDKKPTRPFVGQFEETDVHSCPRT